MVLMGAKEQGARECIAAVVMGANCELEHFHLSAVAVYIKAKSVRTF